MKSGIKSRFIAIVGYPVKVVKRRKFTSVYLNDGTGTIEVRIFDEIYIDDKRPYLILGNLREFRGNIYVAPKFMIKLDNDKQFQVFRLNSIYRYILKGIKFEVYEETIEQEKAKEIKTEEKVLEEPVSDIVELRKLIIKLIDDLDKGEGVDVDELYKMVGEPKREIFDRIIQELLMTGEIYEPVQGKLKLLKDV